MKVILFDCDTKNSQERNFSTMQEADIFIKFIEEYGIESEDEEADFVTTYSYEQNAIVVSIG